MFDKKCKVMYSDAVMKHYTLSEAAKKLGLTRQGLYYWIKKGWVKPKRDYRNYPVFTDKDVLNIKKWQNALK
jgi:DNA-binding transcriptional MerR regulator